MQDDTLKTVCEEIRNCFNDADKLPEITPETKLDALNLDSLNILEVIYELESRFNITVEDSNLTALKTVNDMVNMIDSTLAAAA